MSFQHIGNRHFRTADKQDRRSQSLLYCQGFGLRPAGLALRVIDHIILIDDAVHFAFLHNKATRCE